jgi:hypothetical protein
MCAHVATFERAFFIYVFNSHALGHLASPGLNHVTEPLMHGGRGHMVPPCAQHLQLGGLVSR